VLSFDQIKELVSLVAERRLEELEIERSGFRLKIVGKSPTVAAAPVPAPVAVPPAAASPGAPTPMPTAPVEEDPHAGAHLLTSPIVGTFYMSPSPEADPFVRVGDRVKKGQIICIVEAMKLMNEIEADIDGVVVGVIPQNAQPVEFGEPLFAIRGD
jgi:acetyl-CoA carboxylase biotin carboxyl carrier protein